jgi:hypothetical protein
LAVDVLLDEPDEAPPDEAPPDEFDDLSDAAGPDEAVEDPLDEAVEDPPDEVDALAATLAAVSLPAFEPLLAASPDRESVR